MVQFARRRNNGFGGSEHCSSVARAEENSMQMQQSKAVSNRTEIGMLKKVDRGSLVIQRPTEGQTRIRGRGTFK
jgi:hypothetical protein